MEGRRRGVGREGRLAERVRCAVGYATSPRAGPVAQLILLLPFRQEGQGSWSFDESSKGHTGSMIDDEANEAKAKLNAELLAAGPNDQKDNPAQGSWSFDESSKGYSPLAIATRPVRIPHSINSFRNYLRHLH